MAVIIKIKEGSTRQFLANLIKYIKEGIVLTWKHDDEMNLTVASSLWSGKAWFGLFYNDEEIGFGIIASRHHKLTKELYGVYHGRLVATLLANFDEEIKEMEVTPDLCKKYDGRYIHS